EGFLGVPGKRLSFDASLYELDNLDNVEGFIQNLKSKFKNQAVILDFWATWCSPCLSDMPNSKKLHEANSDLPIAYVYICTNSKSSKKLWESKIADMQLPGTHIYMSEQAVSQLKSSLDRAGSGYPTYIVLGADGKLRSNVIQFMGALDRSSLMTAVGL